MIAQPITGAILAGGRSRQGRTGAERALLPFGDVCLIERQIRVMRELCHEIIVVTDTPKPFLDVLDSSVRLITDYYADAGPLGGMHAALRLAKYSQVWIVGCGMPLISAEAAARLAAFRTPEARSVLPLIGGRAVPLHGVYDKEHAETAGKLLAEGEVRIDRFLGQIRWTGVETESWTKEEGIGDYAFVARTELDLERACKRILHKTSTNGGA
ncbi:molybdenum cofactor guanylyltransferase [Cohnella caldifontis]|uniref:molybdenum cofactor guanylyltransferase n=1 Tax=Cohnella caldifontis TaxID=3027471 RepID=UPI0023ED888D|nr:molybdenum cofactor guanylyltransferase [Cohnella sp. YIM B05605]